MKYFTFRLIFVPMLEVYESEEWQQVVSMPIEDLEECFTSNNKIAKTFIYLEVFLSSKNLMNHKTNKQTFNKHFGIQRQLLCI